MDYFKELAFYNRHIEKPKIKRLKDNDLLLKLLFMKNWTLLKQIMHLEDMQ